MQDIKNNTFKLSLEEVIQIEIYKIFLNLIEKY